MRGAVFRLFVYNNDWLFLEYNFYNNFIMGEKYTYDLVLYLSTEYT